ncbi:MAG: hypothetical protein FJX65_09585 [Alphaproteobacteria bacterium]|nr:hypothetical protein [Alphaproteobacteria bacterium]
MSMSQPEGADQKTEAPSEKLGRGQPRPIAGPSDLVRGIRRGGLAGIVAGFVLVMGRYYTDAAEWIADIGGLVFLAGLVCYFVATIVRLIELNRR